MVNPSPVFAARPFADDDVVLQETDTTRGRTEFRRHVAWLLRVFLDTLSVAAFTRPLSSTVSSFFSRCCIACSTSARPISAKSASVSSLSVVTITAPPNSCFATVCPCWSEQEYGELRTGGPVTHSQSRL